MAGGSVPWILFVESGGDQADRIRAALADVARIRIVDSLDTLRSELASATVWASIVIDACRWTLDDTAIGIRIARDARPAIPILAIARSASADLVNVAADTMTMLRIAPITMPAIHAHAIASRTSWSGLNESLARVAAVVALDNRLPRSEAHLISVAHEPSVREIMMRERDLTLRGYDALVGRLLRRLGFRRLDDLRLDLLRRALTR
jgi:hypothetical protein